MTGVVGLLAAALVGVSSGSAHADVVSTEAVTAGDSVAGDAVSAAGLAWRSRRPVEVLSERTESSETFVLPDGTWRTRQHASPVRVRRGSEWVAVDPTLAVAGGAVVPRAAVLDMRFSNGGSGPLVTIMRGDRSLAISWPDALRVRVPVLDGDTATYAEVLPGVDLRLSAGVDSFAEVLVVKSAEAAKSSELERLRFGLAAQGLSVRQDSTGFLTVAGAAGEVVFASDGARMWDEPQALPARAVAGARSLRAGVTSAGAEVLPQAPESLHVEDVPVHLDGSSLTVVPSKAMLSAADTKFPVYIDPVFNGGSEIWTHVSRKNPSKSYWTDAATRDDMRVGQLWHGSADDDWRTLVQFDITKLKKSEIRSAAVLVNVQHSANCAPSPLQLWQTDPISRSAAVTWNSTKGKWWKVLGEVQATANKSACPKGNDEVKFAQNAVKAAFQAATDPKKPSTITFAFRAKSESDDFQWKKLKPGSAYLEVVYNHKPGKPVLSPISPCFASCAGGTAVTSSKRPSLGMKVADPDGGTLRYEYEVYKSDQTRIHG